MGNDVADINNDALPDIITVDMLPETNARKKSTIGNKSYLNYINNEKYKYEYQYVRNMLHLNNGLNNGIKFSEIGQLAGVHQSEWSWSPLFADFDNDGHKDLVITNGFPKDVTDKDFANYRAQVGKVASIGLLEDSIPVVKIPNYIFRNNGDLTFQDVTVTWGLNHPSFSNGAAFTDLDNDGDLDYVVNNINSEASLYENTLYARAGKRDVADNNFLRIKLTDPTHEKSNVGAKAELYSNGEVQVYENSIYRGFLSSVEDVIHFGLGANAHIDSVIIKWSDGNVQRLEDPRVNEVLVVEYKRTEKQSGPLIEAGNPLFTMATAQSGLSFLHEEDDKIDFNVQRTLPHKFTQSGPGMAVGDINNDGLDDLLVGGSTNYGFSVFFQRRDGTFIQRQKPVRDMNKLEEDEALLLFDADNDKDLDLYVVSGSIEHYQTNDPYQDRLYSNDGNGNFALIKGTLPDTKASGSCVRASDFDADGDLDLFVGGRIVPGKYPLSSESYLLRNDGGKFLDITDTVAHGLKNAGMITDAVWTDFNDDGKTDLIVVGEFTPIMFFENSGKSLKRLKTGIDDQIGWWNSITSGDYDSDGDIDYIAGNLGKNNAFQVTTEFPLKVYAKDFDDNGSMDAIMACYMRESMVSPDKKLFPIHFWDEINTQSPKFRNKFARYRQYGKATIDDLLTAEERQDALLLEANQMASSYIENLGGNKFELRALSVRAQVAPVNGLLTDDVNKDGHPDVVMVGNDYGNEVFVGRYDAFTGLVLLGDGKGNFTEKSSAESGFYVPGDAKALVKVKGVKHDFFVASQNRDSLRVFITLNGERVSVFQPELTDVKAELVFTDGRKQSVEFYYGSGYLSQSTRQLAIPEGVKELLIVNSKGDRRIVAPSTTVNASRN
jgi:hypothetical protein